MDATERKEFAKLYSAAEAGLAAYYKLAAAFRMLWPEFVLLTNERDNLTAELDALATRNLAAQHRAAQENERLRELLAGIDTELLRRAAGYAHDIDCASCPFGEDCKPDYQLEPWECRRDAAALEAAAEERE